MILLLSILAIIFVGFFLYVERDVDAIMGCFVLSFAATVILTMILSGGFNVEQLFVSPSSHTIFDGQHTDKMIVTHNQYSHIDTLPFYELTYSVVSNDTTWFFVDAYEEVKAVSSEDCSLIYEEGILPYMITREWKRPIGRSFYFPRDVYRTYEIRISSDTRLRDISNKNERKEN